MNNFIGKWSEIPESLKPLIKANSFNELSPVNLDALAFLTLSYYGFDDKIHQGEMVVHHSIAEEVIEIFQELFDARFPIERMNLIDYFGGNDALSMESNNSYGFCYRANITFPDQLSKHSYGLAIDINPIQNPYIKESTILPKSGKSFLNRSNSHKGIILPNSAAVIAFTKRGWIWGGSFEGRIDYHHFEKA